MTEEIFTCYTLVDITNTGTLRYNNTQLGQQLRDQQRNWETLVQSIGMRAQPTFLQPPTSEVIDNLSGYEFGSGITGPARVWSFVFGSEHRAIYSVPTLMRELHQVPVTLNLMETAPLPLAIFDTSSNQRNTYFVLGTTM